MKFVIIIGAGLGVVMLFLLASAGENTEFFERRYRLLLEINIVLVAVFMIIVVFYCYDFDVDCNQVFSVHGWH